MYALNNYMACCCCPCTKPDTGDKPSPDFANRWKLTLPDASEKIDVTKSYEPYYTFTDSEITFRCKSNSGTTPNTKYSRCELREMNGKDKASWHSGKSNKFRYTFKITKQPSKRPRIVIGQIHDSKDDVVEILADFKAGVLEVVHNTDHYGALVTDIKIDTWYTVTIETNSSEIVCSLNDKKVVRKTPGGIPGCYFKVGNYLQSKEVGDEAIVVVKDIKLFQ